MPAAKQQRDTVATLVELSRLGVSPLKVRVIFNMVEHDLDLQRAFAPVLSFLKVTPVAQASLDCRLGVNEIYSRINGAGVDLVAMAADPTDFKGRMAATPDLVERLALAQRLALHRLASGVVPELDACFAALGLEPRVGLRPPPDDLSGSRS